MSESEFSQEAQGQVAVAPPEPPIIKSVTITGRKAKVAITLPILDLTGANLTELKEVNVFYKNTSFASSSPAAERAAGTPMVTAQVNAQIGEVEVEVDNLDYGTTYFFIATCND